MKIRVEDLVFFEGTDLRQLFTTGHYGHYAGSRITTFNLEVARGEPLDQPGKEPIPESADFLNDSGGLVPLHLCRDDEAN